MEGKLILKKVQLNDTLFDGYYGWLSPYYVYDYFNNLRYVLSPKALQYAWSNSWALNLAVRNELCFQYNYDSLDRTITKIVPGAGMVNLVYDARNRLVMSQDSLQRLNGNWIVTGYDSMDRKIITSLWSNSNSRSYCKTGIYIPKLKDGYGFSMYANNLDSSSQQEAIQIFRSFQYKK